MAGHLAMHAHAKLSPRSTSCSRITPIGLHQDKRKYFQAGNSLAHILISSTINFGILMKSSLLSVSFFLLHLKFAIFSRLSLNFINVSKYTTRITFPDHTFWEIARQYRKHMSYKLHSAICLHFSQRSSYVCNIPLSGEWKESRKKCF